VSASQGTVLRVGSNGAYLFQYSAVGYRDYRGLRAYYASLGLTFDLYGAAAADTSYLLDSSTCN
jgi:hypothetical protein